MNNDNNNIEVDTTHKKHILCYMNIHKPINKKFNSKYWYTNKSCERCGCDVGFPRWKLNALPKSDS